LIQLTYSFCFSYVSLAEDDRWWPDWCCKTPNRRWWCSWRKLNGLVVMSLLWVVNLFNCLTILVHDPKNVPKTCYNLILGSTNYNQYWLGENLTSCTYEDILHINDVLTLIVDFELKFLWEYDLNSYRRDQTTYIDEHSSLFGTNYNTPIMLLILCSVERMIFYNVVNYN
jgi:hypothetical protein